VLIILVLLIASVYLFITALMYARQDSLIFPVGAVGSAPNLPSGSARLEIRIESGEHLIGAYIPATIRADAPVVIGFGGNAWNGEAVALYLHELYPAADVVAFHYRGYPPSEGRPSAAALLEDGPQIYDLIAKRFAGRPIVAVGFSIGTAVAVRVARERRLAGLILVTPFDSLRGVAHDHLPWLPVGSLLRHRMEPAQDLHAVSTAVAIVTAERDEIVSTLRSAALRRAAGKLVFDRSIAGVGHNEIYDRGAFREAMKAALSALG